MRNAKWEKLRQDQALNEDYKMANNLINNYYKIINAIFNMVFIKLIKVKDFNFRQ